jgi:hypothetical protein
MIAVIELHLFMCRVFSVPSSTVSMQPTLLSLTAV